MVIRRIAAAIFIMVLLFSLAFTAMAEERKTPSGIPFYDLESFVDGYMEQYIGKTAPGAAVAVIKDGEIIFSKGYGYADLENKVPVSSSETVFEYGSVSKLFIWTAIMRLREEGKIDLGADIRNYLPEGFLNNLRFDEPVTLLHIMNHTAGFEDYLFDVVLPNTNHYPSFEETLLHCQPKQVYEPGTISAYSNYAAALAAYIVEQIMGQNFHEYLKDNVFIPLEMENTSAHPTLENKPGLAEKRAKGYATAGNGSFIQGGWSYIPLYPVGAVNGNVEDLAKFAIALMPEEGKPSPLFENRATLDEMLSQTHPMGPGFPGFAHGFIEWDGEYRVVGHGGNTAYFSSQFNIVPKDRFGVIVLTNAAGEMDISMGLTQALTGKMEAASLVQDPVLPYAKAIEGSYIPARRMHNGFLEMYAYFNMLRVEVLEPDRIKLSIMGESAEYIQTSPYVFERVKAEGPLFSYNFDKIYFEMKEDKVFRMSGDFTPLPSHRSEPFLIAGAALAAVSALYFTIAPVVLLIQSFRKRKAETQISSLNKRTMKFSVLLTLCGAVLFINNALLALRMLIDNYRSFSEMRPQILLNYPLAAAVVTFLTLMLANFKSAKLTKRQKTFCITTSALTLVLIGLLADWQFFKVLS